MELSVVVVGNGKAKRKKFYDEDGLAVAFLISELKKSSVEYVKISRVN